MDDKICTSCKKSFPATPEYFVRQKSNKDGLCNRCKNCTRESQRKSRANKNNKSAFIGANLTIEEKKIIEGYAKESNLELSTYIRMVTLKNAPIIVKDMSNYEQLEKEIEQLSYFLSKIGNNINQIAKNLNERKDVPASTIEKMTEVMNRLNDKMENIEEQVCSVYKKWQ